MIKCRESDLRGFFRQDEGEKPQEYFVYFKEIMAEKDRAPIKAFSL